MTLTLPQLTVEDPAVAGEGSLDPLGLGPLGERLGSLLLPAITNRMRRPRFLTAMSAAALACEGLDESVEPADHTTIPSTAFEWLMLEAIVRRPTRCAPDELNGVPGSSKVRVAIEKGERLSAGNYLKTPTVFGFTGVLLPLARAMALLDRDRRAREQVPELVAVWEQEQDLAGFAGEGRHGTGASFRRSLRSEVQRALEQGRCDTATSSHLLGQLVDRMRPGGAGPSERSWLRQAIVETNDEVGIEIASGLARCPFDSDRGLLDTIRAGASSELAARLDAVTSYEAVAVRLEAVFDSWMYQSTQSRHAAVTPSQVGASESVAAALKGLAAAADEASDRLDAVGLAEPFEQFVDLARDARSGEALAAAIMAHHEAIQARKLPVGKRPWFEPVGTGYVVRGLYHRHDASSTSFDHFNRPYRLSTYQSLLSELT